MDNLKTSVGADGCHASVKTGPLSVALKAKLPMGCDVFEIVGLVEAEMHGQPLNAKTVYAFTEEVRKRIADLIVVEIDEPRIPSANSIDGRAGASVNKKLYEAVFELKDGKKIFGYSEKDVPTFDGRFYLCASNKELKGRVAVTAESVISFRFNPL
ncbi:hypothetical protein [Cedecea sp. P7760]|uniref:hypothetical protein n=1 Tax=Cedecea sp. P7760 TaxID=2726983 RepID=UPI0015A198CA|nr:hypothetical protein [Cedecea sp. P7760]NWC65935.1 hypothetical protein [Cedecea sp. P7760]